MRRTILFLLILLFITASCAYGETVPDEVLAWAFTHGGDGLTTATAMAAATEGGVFIAGSTDSGSGDFGEGLGGKDGLILRLDAEGNTLWWQRLGGSEEDVFTAILETYDGGCVAMGYTTSSDGDARSSRGGKDAWLVRLDAAGEMMWTKCLGGSLDDEFSVLLMTEDGQFFACGRTQSRNGDLGANFGGWDAWAILLSGEDGKPIGEAYRFGYEGDDEFLQALPTAEGWLLLGSVSEQVSTDAEDNPVYLSRPIAQILTAEMEPRWETPILLGDTGQNRLYEALETESGWLLAGVTNSRSPLMPANHGGDDIWLLNLRTSGTVAWQRAYGGSSNERLHSIYPLASGGFVLLGETDSTNEAVYGAHGNGSDVWLVRIGETGAQEWQQPIGGSDSSHAAGLFQLEDGGFMIGGTTITQDGDIGRHLSVRTGFLTCLTSNGNILWTTTLAPGEECSLHSLAAYNGIGYVLGTVRSVNADGPVEYLWIARLAQEGVSIN